MKKRSRQLCSVLVFASVMGSVSANVQAQYNASDAGVRGGSSSNSMSGSGLYDDTNPRSDGGPRNKFPRTDYYAPDSDASKYSHEPGSDPYGRNRTRTWNGNQLVR